MASPDAPPLGMQWAQQPMPFCEHCLPLRSDTNVLVLARITLLHKLADINLWLALLSIMYLAVNIVLLVITSHSIFLAGEKLVDGGVFHTLDFGSTFCFALVEVLTLVYSPERRFSSPLLLKVLMFFNMCSTFMGLLFVLLNRSHFEYLAHNIEYANELSMALIDSALVSTIVFKAASAPKQSLLSGGATPRDEESRNVPVSPKLTVAAATLIPVAISAVQLLVYNGFGVDARGHVLGELAAHVLEFIFNAVCATINFWFCLDSKFLADQLARQIMLEPQIALEPPPTRSNSALRDVRVDTEPLSRQPSAGVNGFDHSHMYTTVTHTITHRVDSPSSSPTRGSPRDGAPGKRVPWSHPSGGVTPAAASLTEFLLPESLGSNAGATASPATSRHACGCKGCEECELQSQR